MKVSAVLNQKNQDVVSLPPSATVAVAARLMSQKGLGAILVQNQDGHLIGIVSERDLIRVTADLGEGAFNLQLDDVISRQVQTCRSLDDVSSVVKTMNTYQIRHVPVVDQSRVVGMISVRDVIGLELREREQEVSGYLALLRLRPQADGYLS